MVDVNLTRVREAAGRIAPLVPPSAVKQSVFLQKKSGLEVHLKLENLNLSGSFKIRGAANALLAKPREALAKGVVAASAGNHAQGVAYTCRHLGVQPTIFMPERTPLVKADSTRELGADVRLEGRDYDEAYAAARVFVEETGATFIHPFADPLVIAGQGTIALELLDQIPNLGLVLCSIGGGGLISGVACAIKELKPEIQVVGVQTEAFPAMKRSLDEGRPVTVKGGSTIADGIAVKETNPMTFELISRYVDEVVLVDEKELATSVMDLMERDHMLAEGAGAAAVAGLLKVSNDVLRKVGDKAACCVVSGGNMDVNLLHRLIPIGLRYSGRLMRLSTRLSDRPGRLAELLQVVGSTGANLLEVSHNRLFGVTSRYEEVEVQLDLETTDHAHQRLVWDKLKAAGFTVSATEG